MAGTVTGVLKKNQVQVGGARCVTPGAAAPAPSGRPEVRIVEKNDHGAVVEVRCACGRFTYVQCRWPGPAPAAKPNA